MPYVVSSNIDRLRLPPALASRTLFFAEADRSVFEHLHAGVVFIIAFWSVPAIQAFAALKRVLTELDPDGRLQLMVIDTDGCPDIYQMEEFKNRINGYGETAWICAGKIVRTSGNGFQPDCFAEYTRLTLAELNNECP